jgi:hypothetical protein
VSDGLVAASRLDAPLEMITTVNRGAVQKRERSRRATSSRTNGFAQAATQADARMIDIKATVARRAFVSEHAESAACIKCDGAQACKPGAQSALCADRPGNWRRRDSIRYRATDWVESLFISQR